METKVLEARDKGQFLTLEMNAIFANLRKGQVAYHLEHKVEILNANQQINQLLRNSFQWFHEDSLAMDAINIVPPTRLQVFYSHIIGHVIFLYAIFQGRICMQFVSKIFISSIIRLYIENKI